MAVVKVDFDKPYDEFEIGGETYHVYFDDDSLRRYEKEADEFQKEALKQVDFSKMSARKRKEVETKQIEAIKDTIEPFFGEGSFDSIYAASGKSMLNMVKVLEAVFDWLNTKVQSVNNRAA